MTTEAALQDLTGLFQALSGIVYDNQKKIFGFPTKADFSNLSTSHVSQFNSLNASLTTLQETVDDLVGFVQNLKLSQSQIITDYTTHTGSVGNHSDIDTSSASSGDILQYTDETWSSTSPTGMLEEFKSFGWQDFSHSGTGAQSLTEIAGGEIALLNDASGAYVAIDNVGNSPYEVGIVWDPVSSSFNFDSAGINLFDVFEIRVALEVTPYLVPHESSVLLRGYSEPSGGGTNTFTLEYTQPTRSSDAGVSKSLYTEASFFVSEFLTGGSMQIAYTGSSSVDIDVVGWFTRIYKTNY